MLSISPVVLLAVVSLGVGLVVLLTSAVGWSTEARLETAEGVRAAWRLEHPEDTLEDDVLIGVDGRSALVGLGEGGVGLVFVLGDRFVVRRLTPGTLRGVAATQQGIRLRFLGFGRPEVVVRTGQSPETAHWRARLGPGSRAA